MAQAHEVNFDGLIGPTHNHSGLALGNLASLSHKFQTSSPRAAALQGLAKMRLVHSLGLVQGFIPPQERPDIDALREAGYQGTDENILDKASRENPELFLRCCSASSMWCANAATVTPSWDSDDGKTHITIANLKTHPHRAIESGRAEEFFRHIFKGPAFEIHSPLKGKNEYDEGAANHMRLAAHHALQGLHVFVYGTKRAKQKYPARQSKSASAHISKSHNLKSKAVFVEQNADAIAQGVFHNDVIATGNERVLIVHGGAYQKTEEAVRNIQTAFKDVTGQELILLIVGEDQLTVDEAVASYLFNSQIVTRPDGRMSMIAPIESQKGKAQAVIDGIVNGDSPIDDVHYVDLRQSMANGGGPACLRLRVLLAPDELKQVHASYILDDQKFDKIEEWIRMHYRETLTIDELKDPELLKESRRALEKLTNLLSLGRIYSFQK